MKRDKLKTVEEYIKSFPKGKQTILQDIHGLIVEVALMQKKLFGIEYRPISKMGYCFPSVCSTNTLGISDTIGN